MCLPTCLHQIVECHLFRYRKLFDLNCISSTSRCIKKKKRKMTYQPSQFLGQKGKQTFIFLGLIIDHCVWISNHCFNSTGTPNLGPRNVQTADWDFPETPQEIMRCQVFRNFWEQGYYLTSGSKFGGDFLAYPGESWLLH